MKKFKKLICTACISLCGIIVLQNTFAVNYGVSVHQSCSYDKTIGFHLINNKGKINNCIVCAEFDGAPRGFRGNSSDEKVLSEKCTNLSNKFKQGHTFGKIDIDKEEYSILFELCKEFGQKGRNAFQKIQSLSKIIDRIYLLYHITQ